MVVGVLRSIPGVDRLKPPLGVLCEVVGDLIRLKTPAPRPEFLPAAIGVSLDI